MISRDDLPETPDWLPMPSAREWDQMISSSAHGLPAFEQALFAELPERFELGEN